MYVSLVGISIVSTSDDDEVVHPEACHHVPTSCRLFLKSLEAARQIFAECVIIFLLKHEADILAEIEVELDIESNEGHALQLVRRSYRTILRYWSLFTRIFTVEWQC